MKLWAVMIGKKPKSKPYVAYMDISCTTLAVFEKFKEAKNFKTRLRNPYAWILKMESPDA